MHLRREEDFWTHGRGNVVQGGEEYQLHEGGKKKKRLVKVILEKVSRAFQEENFLTIHALCISPRREA